MNQIQRWWSGALAWFTLLSCPIAAASEPVSLRPRWEVGAERRYDITASYRQSVPATADTDRTVTQSARLLLRVAEVDAAGGATVHISFDSLHTELQEPGGLPVEVFDLKPAAGASPADPDAGQPELARLLSALGACTMVVSVGPDGSVGAVAGLVPFVQALQQQAGDSAALRGVGFFSPVQLKRNLAMLWSVDRQPRPREPGGTWVNTDNLVLGDGHEATATTTWTLSGVQNDVADLSAAVSIAPAPLRREPDPATPRLSIANQAGTISVRWGLSAGAPVEVIDDRSAAWSATVDLGPGAATPQISVESQASSRIEIRLVK